MKHQKVKKSFKQRLFHEFTEYWINFTYMAIFFSAVVLYRRLVLAQHGILLEDYFAGVLKALVIAKVVMIGAFLRISRKFEDQPLLIPSIYKAVLFTIWVMIFDFIEIFILAFIHHPVLSEAIANTKNHINLVWLGAALVVFVSFVPFFAFKELTRSIGGEKIRNLFFRRQKFY
jgi:hypothetical protein